MLTLEGLHSENSEIESEDIAEEIKIPLQALKLLAKILKVISQGQSVSVVPISTEMTTPAVAELLGCSRPHFVKLLEEGNIPFSLVGRHPRVKHEDIMDFQKVMKLQRE